MDRVNTLYRPSKHAEARLLGHTCGLATMSYTWEGYEVSGAVTWPLLEV